MATASDLSTTKARQPGPFHRNADDGALDGRVFVQKALDFNRTNRFTAGG